MDYTTRSLLRGILSVVGAASIAACAGRSIDDEGAGEAEESGPQTDSDASDSDASNSNASDSDASNSDASDSDMSDSDASDTDASDSDEVKFDIPSEPTDPGTSTGPTAPETGGDPTGGEDCGELIAEYWELDWQVPGWCEDAPNAWSSEPVCFYPPEGMSCEDQPYSEACLLEGYGCGLISGGEEVGCGPFTTPEGACCYVVYGDCAVGRPFVVGGEARVAGLVAGERWRGAPQPELGALDPATRAALADAWSRYGQTEHASLASFSRFTTQLLALGAPAQLIAASLRAGRDERDHAQRSLGLAAAYAGGGLEPGPLRTQDCHESLDPRTIARALASEGCVGETVSLALLCAAHDAARDVAVKACLARIVADEGRHVLLAWEALAWMCARFGQPARRAAAEVFAEADAHVGFGARTELAGESELMRAHGYLPLAERRAHAQQTLAQVVAPAAAAVLRGAAVHMRAHSRA